MMLPPLPFCFHYLFAYADVVDDTAFAPCRAIFDSRFRHYFSPLILRWLLHYAAIMLPRYASLFRFADSLADFACHYAFDIDAAIATRRCRRAFSPL